MAYEKQTWTTGEVITQEKLNHMEDGIANAGGSDISFFRVTFTDNGDDTLTADKTRAEILQAYVDDMITIGELRVATGTPTTPADITATEWSFIAFFTGGLEVNLGGRNFGSSPSDADSSVIWHKF